jgi:hypothetical protein
VLSLLSIMSLSLSSHMREVPVAGVQLGQAKQRRRPQMHMLWAQYACNQVRYGTWDLAWIIDLVRWNWRVDPGRWVRRIYPVRSGAEGWAWRFYSFRSGA